ncbi:hypothetical protein B296_00028046 [Ensete ventricosum]|uniref:Transmembrane protein n=1 Tax=Ensete ventricosum TaxID=4639 RepID=A0A426X4D7_ENSVE|nr:hypothetical protein B296_00028046 [Ensete ventricosum]
MFLYIYIYIREPGKPEAACTVSRRDDRRATSCQHRQPNHLLSVAAASRRLPLPFSKSKSPPLAGTVLFSLSSLLLPSPPLFRLFLFTPLLPTPVFFSLRLSCFLLASPLLPLMLSPLFLSLLFCRTLPSLMLAQLCRFVCGGFNYT